MKRITLLAIILMATLTGPVTVFGQDSGLAVPEQQAMSDTVQNALENNKTNQPSDWANPDTGNSGGVTPVRTFTGAQGQPCREFISTIVIGGQEQQGYGTACRQPDGTWQIVANDTSAAQPPQETQTNIYVNNPPPQYYSYPADLYYPYHIYLSFGFIYREGYVYRGAYFLGGRDFRHRYPLRIHKRVFVTPHDRDRYLRHRSWWEYRDRDRKHWKNKERWERRNWNQWQDHDRGNEPWRGRGHKH